MKLLFVGAVIAALVVAYLYFQYKVEGFACGNGLNVSPSLFVPATAPGGYDEESSLSPGPALNPITEKIIESPALPPMSIPEAESNFGKMTSERCFRTDIGESLKKTRNYLQRTNNYVRKHPDDCSAPNHEFVGTFYNPFDGVGRTPATGTNYPPSTQCDGGY